MNKNLLCAAFIAMAATTASPAFADGQVTLKGSIDAATCPVKGGSNTNGDNDSFIVTLDSVSESAFSSQGSRAGAKGFSIIIGGPGEAGCGNGKMATLRFDGSRSPVNGVIGVLNNVNGTAKGVGIYLQNGAGQWMDLKNNTNTSSGGTISNNTVTLNFTAEYIRPTSTAVTAGSVDTYVMYTVEYN